MPSGVPLRRKLTLPTLFLNSNIQPNVSPIFAKFSFPPYSLGIGGPPGLLGYILRPPVHIQP